MMRRIGATIAVLLVICAAVPFVLAARGNRGAQRALGALAPGLAISPDSLQALRAEVEYLRAASAERDTLLQQVRETQDFIDSVDVDLAQLAGPDSVSVVPQGEGGDSALSMREIVRRRLQRVSDRLARSDSTARARAERLRELGQRNAVLESRVAELDSSVARFREIVEGQRGQIASLIARVDTLERANAALVAERGVLTDSVTRLVARADSVYVVAASRQELLRLGVAVEEGGAKLPLFGRVSTALVPAQVQRPAAFLVLDRRRDRVITLPNTGRAYRIISAHDPALLDPAQPGDPVVKGAVRIADPERFWAQSRYLVLVEL